MVNSVFVIVLENNKIGATTRPPEKVERQGLYGLIGGKVEKGETPYQAVKRESKEEGWDIEKILPNPVFKTTRGKKLVWYYLGFGATPRKKYKEKGRVDPVWIDINDIPNKTDRNIINQIKK